VGGKGGGGGKGGEMTQALYAHMNKIKKKESLHERHGLCDTSALLSPSQTT
jgi:hypothetical protein